MQRPIFGVPLRALFAAFALACASGGNGVSPPLPIEVMSFNIRYGTARDSANAWTFRRELLMDVIGAHRPHVLALQEALRFQLDEIRRGFGDYAEVGVGRDDGREAGEYAAILYDTDRLELLDQGHFWFSAMPETPGSRSWGNNVTRICTWVHLRDRTSGATFHVYNVHWDHESQPSRDSSAVLLQRRMAARPQAEPVILAGDFNAGEANSAFQRLLLGSSPGATGAPRLLDTFRSVNPSVRNVGTFHGFRGTVDGEKIDAVLVSQEWNVIDAGIVRTSDEGRYPSDHYPVTARIVLRGN